LLLDDAMLVFSRCHFAVGKRMRSATTWMGIAGGAIMVLLIGRDFRGAVITGILVVTFISWIPGHSVRGRLAFDGCCCFGPLVCSVWVSVASC
jgi:xanthine/uracil/vitamin C permease (AzgA family)